MQSFKPGIDGFYQVDHQMTLDLRLRAQAHFQYQSEEKAGLVTVADFERHREKMRASFLGAIGGLPGEEDPAQRTPPPARVTGRLERETFFVEKIIYESLPDFPVTAACYIPKNAPAQSPAVVMVHGHADMGKSQPNYQQVCIDLVQNGFIVLAMDPPGQGERHLLGEGGTPLHTACTYEHTHCGLPFWLNGTSIARHFIWDAMRSLDYLIARGDVDEKRIGVTGSSGGGTQTCYLMMCEPRLAAAVPCTFVMTLESYQKTGQPQDAEQIIFGAMKQGPDHDDYLTAMAPRPVLVGAAAYDFFPIEGAHEAVRRAKRIYELYGKPENVAIEVAPTIHQYSAFLRQACVNWFLHHLQNAPPNFVTGNPEPFPEAKLWATKSGEIYRDDPTAKTIFDLNAAALPDAPPFATAEDLRKAIDQVLGVQEAGDRSLPIFPRIISDIITNGFRSEKTFFFGAPGIALTGVLVHPRGASAEDVLPVTLLLLEHGTDDIPAMRPAIEAILRKRHRVFIFDVRGIGAVKESSSSPESEFQVFNSEYKLGCDALMLGLSTLGLRIFDVLRAYDYLHSRLDTLEVHAYGCKSGAIFALYASLLETRLASLTCEDMLISYRDLCLTRDYQMQVYNLKIMAWGLLKCGDLLGHAAAIAPRSVTLIRPRNALGEVIGTQLFASICADTGANESWPKGWVPALK